MFANDDKTVSRYAFNKLGSFYPNILTKMVNDPFIRDAYTLIAQIKKRTGIGIARPKFNFMGQALSIKEGTFEDLNVFVLFFIVLGELRGLIPY